MAEGDLTCSRVNADYAIISREGRFGSSTFFRLGSREEAALVIQQLSEIINKDIENDEESQIN